MVSVPSPLLLQSLSWPTVATDWASASSGRLVPHLYPAEARRKTQHRSRTTSRRRAQGNRPRRSFWRLSGVKEIIRELKRQAAGEKLSPEQLKGLIRAGYVYRIGDEHHLTDMGRHALAQPGAYPGEAPPGTEIVEAFRHPGE
jgi:hypothetical protein